MRFTGEFRYLSNFYLCPIILDGLMFSSVEAAYQAAKTLDPVKRFEISEMGPGTAKREGRALRLRTDWEYVKVKIMRQLVQQKFSDPLLLRKLRKVQGEIVEHNVWHDNFWGRCTCARCVEKKTHNWLGRILMEVRDAV